MKQRMLEITNFITLLFVLLLFFATSIILTSCNNADLNHTEHSFDKSTVIDPTCVNKGYTIRECECGETVKTDYILPLQHTYSDFEIRTKATTYSVGLKERICTVCGLIDREIIPKATVKWEIVQFDNSNLYVGEIDLPSLEITGSSSIPDSLKTEFNIEERTITVKVEDLSPNTYDDLKNIVLTTFVKDNSDIVIGDVKIENIEDYIIFIEDENGNLIPVPWE